VQRWCGGFIYSGSFQGISSPYLTSPIFYCCDLYGGLSSRYETLNECKTFFAQRPRAQYGDSLITRIFLRVSSCSESTSSIWRQFNYKKKETHPAYQNETHHRSKLHVYKGRAGQIWNKDVRTFPAFHFLTIAPMYSEAPLFEKQPRRSSHIQQLNYLVELHKVRVP
jgi:hypothetical protein